MNTNLEKSVAFDESCAQENVLSVQSFVPLQQHLPSSTLSGGKIDKLDFYLWMLCSLLGTLFGKEFLPLIEAWLKLS